MSILATPVRIIGPGGTSTAWVSHFAETLPVPEVATEIPRGSLTLVYT